MFCERILSLRGWNHVSDMSAPRPTPTGEKGVYCSSINPSGDFVADNLISSFLPDVGRDSLIWVVNQIASLDLVEGSVGKIVGRDALSQPTAPLQSQTRLEVIPHNEHRNAQNQGPCKSTFI
jgi:hypothetical protein